MWKKSTKYIIAYYIITKLLKSIILFLIILGLCYKDYFYHDFTFKIYFYHPETGWK